MNIYKKIAREELNVLERQIKKITNRYHSTLYRKDIKTDMENLFLQLKTNKKGYARWRLIEIKGKQPVWGYSSLKGFTSPEEKMLLKIEIKNLLKFKMFDSVEQKRKINSMVNGDNEMRYLSTTIINQLRNKRIRKYGLITKL